MLRIFEGNLATRKLLPFLFVFSGVCHAQTIVTQKPLEMGIAHKDDWLKDKWSGSERPYREIRDDIDRAFSQKRAVAPLVSLYATRAKKAPFDPLERFGEIYLIYKRARLREPSAMREITQLIAQFREFPSPHKYEFDRIHFLVSAFCFPHPRLMPLGNRLIGRDPNDYDVKYHMINILDMRNLAQRQQAIGYAQDLRRLLPNSAQPYKSVAAVHFQIWLLKRSPQEGVLAVKNYQKFLQLAPPQDPFRPQAKTLIKMVTK